MLPITIFLTQFFGIFLVAIALSMALRRKMMLRIIHDVFGNRGVTYVWGTVMLIISLFIILNHFLWTNLPEIVVSVLGWLMLVESLMYIFLRKKAFIKMEKKFTKSKIYSALLVLNFIAGLYLVYVGFFLS
ncbi:MAG: hypothetical protein ACI83D_000009 [Planctomycetota bacterium]|jgi:hypothetical protein